MAGCHEADGEARAAGGQAVGEKPGRKPLAWFRWHGVAAGGLGDDSTRHLQAMTGDQGHSAWAGAGAISKAAQGVDLPGARRAAILPASVGAAFGCSSGGYDGGR
jgi:hypothetical protein